MEVIVQKIGNFFFFLFNLEVKDDNDDGQACLPQDLPM